MTPTCPHARRRLAAASIALLGALCVLGVPAAQAQRPAPVPKSAVKVGGAWSELTPAQRSALAPLEHEWASLGPERRAKWLQVAARFPSMSEAERERAQARMSAWSQLSPQERGQARLRSQEVRGLSAQERQARWEQYQALPPEKRRQFAGHARESAAHKVEPPAARSNGSRASREGAGAQAKSNLVPNPAFAAPPKAVAPALVQAKPGATTNLISKSPKPPPHQQVGLPKIAATPGFVDSSTLLPQRGPQGAATRPRPAASDNDKRR